MELESSPHYTIVSRDTAPNGILVSASFLLQYTLTLFLFTQALLYSHFDLVLGDADWLTARLKTSLATDPMEDILGMYL